MKSITKYDSPFSRIYHDFEKDLRMDLLFERIYRETQIFCGRQLSHDPDLVADFLLHFFENRFEHLIREFQKRNHPSFPGFYILAVRNSFANFLRSQRRRTLPTVPLNLSDDDPVAAALVYHCELERSSHRFSPRKRSDIWDALERALSCLKGIDPILFKMYHNIPLSIDELRRLTERYGIEKTGVIVSQLASRHNYRIERLEVVRRRMDRYMSRRLRGEYPGGRRKRESYMQTYRNRHWVHSVQGIAALLEISKQFASFRLRKTTEYLRVALGDYITELHTEEAG